MTCDMAEDGKVKFVVWTYPEVLPYLKKAAELPNHGPETASQTQAIHAGVSDKCKLIE